MRFISVFHALSALVVAAVAAPVEQSAGAVAIREPERLPVEENSDIFSTIDINGTHLNQNEVDPEAPAGCIVA
ncbi:hypothetical protein R3P38DRAFT_2911105 [Favolaschia claudopus]|uniref:Uncharacterized protein n=1 Tax=Favolaschia claudopus TaxID=2862362 RepID=A0AAW0CD65_9AGAR